MGSDVLLQPSTLQADNHKKRTGFGPQQASFGVYVSNAFGGMSGALNLGAIPSPDRFKVNADWFQDLLHLWSDFRVRKRNHFESPTANIRSVFLRTTEHSV